MTTRVRVSSCHNRFYREVEVKHSRVAMLAAVGFPLAEHWHPLWGGAIDVPSYVAFQATPLQTFWPVVVSAIGVVETFSVFTFERPYDLFYSGSGGFWNIRADHSPGDLQFDPLNLMPTDAACRLEMETKELNHGRLAMVAIVGMVVQELVTGEKLW
jgi:light-harvesting complex I chlorophyll a/b binding protein 4